MKIIYSWLKEFVDFDWSPEELASRLTMTGLEIEGIERVGASFKGVIIGKVVSREKHPNADKLSVCRVDLGDGHPVQIVCGAPNVAAGQTVPVATAGAVLGADFTIKKATIRGQESNGMICSKSELGLEEGKSDGIWVLDESLTAGLDLASVLNIREDYVLEVAITANRGDALSHLGVARDVAALAGKTVRFPDLTVDPKYISKIQSSEKIKIELDSPDQGPIYAGWYLEGVTARPSPEWMQTRLTQMGLRPRNILVDVTNYVMMELGQPLHAFDYDRLKSGTIRVKTTGPGPFTTLDSKERQLPDQALMICDGNDPVAVAGIMGGENSEVEDSTSRVLLESAWFNPSSVRKTAKKLGISTDSSYRFERGIDSGLQKTAALRAAKLIVENTGGKMAETPVMAVAKHLIQPELTLRFSQIKRILGIEIPKEKVHQILDSLGFVMIGENQTEMMVRVPAHRPDVTREIDLIEELIRIYGFHHVPEAETVSVSYTAEQKSSYSFDNKLRFMLTGAGFQEILCNSMIPEKDALLVTGKIVPILNPQSEEMGVLRPALAPGMLAIVQKNQNHGITDLRFFELGHCFTSVKSDRYSKIGNHQEEIRIGLMMTGQTVKSTWNSQPESSTLFHLKGTVLAVLDVFRLSEPVTVTAVDSEFYEDCLVLSTGNVQVGHIGKISKKVQSFFGLKQPVFIAELILDSLYSLPKHQPRYQELPKFLPVEKDMAFWVSRSVPAGEMVQSIQETNPGQISQVTVFDVFEDPKNQQNQKSVGFRMTLQNPEKTFTDQEIDGIMTAVRQMMEKKFNASLRGG